MSPKLSLIAPRREGQPRRRPPRGLTLLRGMAALAVGAVGIAWPGIAVNHGHVILGVWLLLDGTLAIVSLVEERPGARAVAAVATAAAVQAAAGTLGALHWPVRLVEVALFTGLVAMAGCCLHLVLGAMAALRPDRKVWFGVTASALALLASLAAIDAIAARTLLMPIAGAVACTAGASLVLVALMLGPAGNAAPGA